jgi:mediator of RNA polymerase II transcription subunit 12
VEAADHICVRHCTLSKDQANIYRLQLATHLYKEHLLDNDHFLGWILDGVDTCPPERLFIWLLVVAVPHYWNDISSCRQRGKRLAESLLIHLGKVWAIAAVLH